MPTIQAGFEDRGNALASDLLIQNGPTLYVRAGFDPLFSTRRPSPPNLPSQTLPALVDTGAGESCIDSTLAMQLDLPIVDRRPVSGVHGSEELNYHLAQIVVPGLDHTIHGQFAGVHLVAGGLPFVALIGRTFLRNYILTYDGRSGEVTLSSD